MKRSALLRYLRRHLYPTIVDKAAALGFALIQGHAFVDGNKRIGHAATEVFLGSSLDNRRLIEN